MKRLISVFVVSILVFASVSLARTWYVTPDGTGDAPTIQAGIDSASAGDEVVLADGVFTGPGNRDMLLGRGKTVRSESGHPEACVIDCQGTESEYHKAFFICRTGCLEGVSIINGFSAEYGSAVSADGGVTMTGCIFAGNFSWTGGAVFVSDVCTWDITVISHCQFIGNEAVWGACALQLGYKMTMVALDHCTFFGNQKELLHREVIGYAHWSDDVDYFSMTSCTFVGNGGGIAIEVPGGRGTVLERTILAYNDVDWFGSFSEITCCNFYENASNASPQLAAGQDDKTGNFSACPSFCNLAAGDFHLCDESPCAPGNHPDGYDCGLIGAWDVGCVCGPSRTEPTAWGAIKSMYR